MLGTRGAQYCRRHPRKPPPVFTSWEQVPRISHQWSAYQDHRRTGGDDRNLGSKIDRHHAATMLQYDESGSLALAEVTEWVATPALPGCLNCNGPFFPKFFIYLTIALGRPPSRRGACERIGKAGGSPIICPERHFFASWTTRNESEGECWRTGHRSIDHQGGSNSCWGQGHQGPKDRNNAQATYRSGVRIIEGQALRRNTRLDRVCDHRVIPKRSMYQATLYLEVSRAASIMPSFSNDLGNH